LVISLTNTNFSFSEHENKLAVAFFETKVESSNRKLASILGWNENQVKNAMKSIAAKTDSQGRLAVYHFFEYLI
jgi:hypothetical protein